MSVQTSYSDANAKRTAGIADKLNASQAYPAGDAIPFGRFCRFNDSRQVVKLGANKFTTSTNITTGTITMTIVKKDLAAGTSTANNISVAFDTNNNTTYANLETAIEALGNVAVTLIDDGGAKRGILIDPASGYEFVVTAASFPVTVQADLQQPALGISLVSRIETSEYKLKDSVELGISGAINVTVLEDFNPKEPLYLKLVGTEAQIGCLTKTKDTTSIALSGLKVLSAREDGCALVLI